MPFNFSLSGVVGIAIFWSILILAKEPESTDTGQNVS